MVIIKSGVEYGEDVDRGIMNNRQGKRIFCFDSEHKEKRK